MLINFNVLDCMKYSIYIICSGLFILNLVLGYNVYINNKLFVQEKNLLNRKVDKYYSQNMILREDIIMLTQGVYKLSPQMYFYTELGDSIALSQLKKKKNTLVLRYSYLNCRSCVDNAIARLLEFTNQNDDIDVLLLGSYQNNKDLKIFKQINKNVANVYMIKHLEVPIEDENIPYLFILDEDMQILDLFIPRKEIPELTREYLEKIKKILD